MSADRSSGSSGPPGDPGDGGPDAGEERHASVRRDAGGGPPGGRDPRWMVTPYALGVAEGLIGRPLASPWRRAGAMLLDLLVVLGIVILREVTGPLFLLLLAWLAYRATTDRARDPVRGTLSRIALRATAVLLLLTGLARGIQLVADGDPPPEGPAAGDVPAEAALERSAAEQGAGMALGDMTAMLGGVRELRSGDTARARGAAVQLGRDLRTSGMAPDEIRSVLRSAGEAPTDSTMRLALQRALADLDLDEDTATAAGDSARRARDDSLARSWASALEAGDTAAADSARHVLRGVLAADTARSLERRISVLGSTLRRMEDRLEEAREPPSLISYAEVVARDLGLGLGTLGLYFTAFLALWNGRTPGKRLLGIRVVRLNGEPLGWWDSFSRFGGYAASVLTGLLGFAQLLWHPNRQALHDRIAGTVVIRE